MADRPILFSAPMICALLHGRKTQTRRILKPRRGTHYDDFVDVGPALGGIGRKLECPKEKLAIPFAPGDRLWVREAWTVKRHEPCQEQERDYQRLHTPTIRYAADGEEIRHQGSDAAAHTYHGLVETKKSAIHLPRWLSRLTLIVTGVKVERLQDISATDAEAEGVVWESADPPFYYVPGIFPHSRTAVGIEEPGSSPHAVRSYAKLWEEINGAGSWDENPWVAGISFRVIKANIDQIEASP